MKATLNMTSNFWQLNEACNTTERYIVEPLDGFLTALDEPRFLAEERGLWETKDSDRPRPTASGLEPDRTDDNSSPEWTGPTDHSN
jgi:hypothetical protein